MTLETMKWIVGLDLHPSGAGAIRFARWLAESSSASGSLVGIHVLEEDYLRSALKYHHLDELLEGATAAAEKAVEAAGATPDFGSLLVLQGSRPTESLSAAYTSHAAQGLIIGRQANKDGRDIFRLGRVARRILRSLPGPTFVVPPDYETEGADGPIVVAVSLREDCEVAVRFAADMAEKTGRPLVLLHVVPTPDDYGAHYLPEASLVKMRDDNRTEAEEELSKWAGDGGCASAECVVLLGGIVSETVRFTTQRRAAVLVSGSRRLSTFERLLLNSIASELAATATCPVAVVSPA
ncbi:MAG: universal stress protein [Nannocystaceae bacterium]|nr:universal stress protein [Nannocystaceae bacterium]